MQPIHVEAQGYEEGLQKALELGYVSYGGIVVATYGLGELRQKVEILRVVG